MITEYVARDGKRFSSEADALAYEAELDRDLDDLQRELVRIAAVKAESLDSLRQAVWDVLFAEPDERGVSPFPHDKPWESRT